MKMACLAGLIVAGGLLTGCNSYSGDGYATRQEGNYDVNSSVSKEQVAVPVPGDTTGSGLRRDARTGGVIDTNTVTGADAQRISPVAPSRTPGASSGTAATDNGPDVGGQGRTGTSPGAGAAGTQGR